jgi:hypothetical protein
MIVRSSHPVEEGSVVGDPAKTGSATWCAYGTFAANRVVSPMSVNAPQRITSSLPCAPGRTGFESPGYDRVCGPSLDGEHARGLDDRSPATLFPGSTCSWKSPIDRSPSCNTESRRPLPRHPSSLRDGRGFQAAWVLNGTPLPVINQLARARHRVRPRTVMRNGLQQRKQLSETSARTR